jgi:hypothetical protein
MIKVLIAIEILAFIIVLGIAFIFRYSEDRLSRHQIGILYLIINLSMSAMMWCNVLLMGWLAIKFGIFLFKIIFKVL